MKNQNISVKEAEEYLDQIPKFSKEKHTVDTVRQMLKILGDPQEKLKIIHVAGTNGKGSVCAFLASILRTAGYSAAVFTSPHLVSVKERFAFDSGDVDDALFLRAFSQITEHLESFEQAGLGHPSYFEFLFLMFMMMVKERPSDYVVLETGLGGRLDATNAIDHPVVTVITSISLDHMEYLGDTVTKIAGEKAGIIKAGAPVVYDNTSKEASDVIARKAYEMGSMSDPVDASSYSELVLQDGHLHLRGTNRTGTETLALEVPFAAEYQAVNAMLAVRTAELLDIPNGVISQGIKKAVWAGRMEEIKEHVYLDGAHNEGGIREFAKAAGRIVQSEQIAGQIGRKILLFAVVSDKEYGEMAEIICREFAPDVLVLTQLHCSRGLDIAELERVAHRAWEQVDHEHHTLGEQHDIRVIGTVEQAFDEVLKEKRPEDTVFCAGSLYLIGEIKEVLRRNKA
ncbi:MAG: folylpolyglutamate synthase/dihydrofolate synthase family protein [Clostridium sp.]